MGQFPTKEEYLLEKSISVGYFVHKKVCILPVIYLSIFIISLENIHAQQQSQKITASHMVHVH